MRVGNFVELRVNVRQADAERLQTIFGLLPALALAAGLRLYAVLRFPFLHDEPRLQDGLHAVLGYGPSQTIVGPWPQSLMFGAPLQGGMQNITPLWWWLEFAVLRLWPGDETLALRLPTLAFGLIGLALFYRLARRLLAPPIPALLAWLLAVHDIYLWLGTKAQFVETAIFLAALAVAYALLAAPDRWRSFVGASAAVVLACGYFLPKGLMLAVHALAVGGLQAVFPRSEGRRLDWALLGRRALVAGLIAAPLAGWLWAAQAYIDRNYQIRVGDIGYFRSLVDVLGTLTFGFGQTAHVGLTGPPRTALLYYSQADAWPTSTFLAPLILLGYGLAAWTLVARWRESREARWQTALYVAVVIPLGLAPVLWKGAAGERFHMTYFAAALLAAGLALEELWRGRRWQWGLFLAGLGVYVGAMLSWADWLAGAWQPGAPLAVAAALGLAAGAGYALARPAGRRWIVVGVVAAGIALSLARGPLHWGLTAPYSPEPYNGILQAVEAVYHPQ